MIGICLCRGGHGGQAAGVFVSGPDGSLGTASPGNWARAPLPPEISGFEIFELGQTDAQG